MTVVLVRHAIAMRRRDWTDDDDLRPLTPRGERQAEALVGPLRSLGVTAVMSSPSVRCLDTVEPFTSSAGVPLETRDELREGRGLAALPLLRASGDEAFAVCSHGDVLLALLATLTDDAESIDGPDVETFEKGALWVVDAGRSGTTARYVPPPA